VQDHRPALAGQYGIGKLIEHSALGSSAPQLRHLSLPGARSGT
jgi:hypothetical protein